MAEITAKDYVEQAINEYEDMRKKAESWLKTIVIFWLAFWFVSFIAGFVDMFVHRDVTIGLANVFFVLGFIMIAVAMPLAVKVGTLSSAKTKLEVIKVMVENPPSE